jgi:hypothetical protein
VSAGAPLDLAADVPVLAGLPVLDGVGTELADARGFLAALGRVVTAFGLITSVRGLAVPVTAGVPVSGADAPERRDPRDRVVRRSRGPSVGGPSFGLMTRAYVSLVVFHAAPSRFMLKHQCFMRIS